MLGQMLMNSMMQMLQNQGVTNVSTVPADDSNSAAPSIHILSSAVPGGAQATDVESSALVPVVRRGKGPGRGRGRGGQPPDDSLVLGRQGLGRLVDYSVSALKRGREMLEEFQVSSVADLRREFFTKYEQKKGDLKSRSTRLAMPDSADSNIGPLSRDLDVMAQCFDGYMQLHEGAQMYKFPAGQKSLSAMACLTEATRIMDFMDKKNLISGVWQKGCHRPCFLREMHHLMKVTHACKNLSGQALVLQLVLLLNEDQLEQVAPIEIVEKLPERLCEYMDNKDQREDMLRHHWQPFLVVRRWYTHALRQLSLHCSAPVIFADIIIKVFENVFDELKGSAGERDEPESKRQKVEKVEKVADDDVNVDDLVDIDIADLDLEDFDVMDDTEAERRKTKRQISCEDDIVMLRHMVAIFFPHLFEAEVVREGLEVAEKPGKRKDNVYIDQLMGTNNFDSHVLKARKLLTKRDQFSQWLLQWKGKIETIKSFCHGTMEVERRVWKLMQDMDAMDEAALSPAATSVVTLICTWNKKHGTKLTPLLHAEELFDELSVRFDDPDVQGDQKDELQRLKVEVVQAVRKCIFLGKTMSSSSIYHGFNGILLQQNRDMVQAIEFGMQIVINIFNEVRRSSAFSTFIDEGVQGDIWNLQQYASNVMFLCCHHVKCFLVLDKEIVKAGQELIAQDSGTPEQFKMAADYDVALEQLRRGELSWAFPAGQTLAPQADHKCKVLSSAVMRCQFDSAIDKWVWQLLESHRQDSLIECNVLWLP